MLHNKEIINDADYTVSARKDRKKCYISSVFILNTSSL